MSSYHRAMWSLFQVLLVISLLFATTFVHGQSSEDASPQRTPSANKLSRFRTYSFKNIKAADALKALLTINGVSEEELDATGGIVVNERTNSIVFRNVAGEEQEDLEVEEFFKLLDVEIPISANGARITPATSGVAPSVQTFSFSVGFERGESLESLKQRYSELEQQTHELAGKLKQSKSQTETERKELQFAVRKSFEARQALQRAELGDLAQRMKSMQQSIDMRDKLADKVVERRMEDLLNPNLKWEVAQARGESTRSIANMDALSSPNITTSKQLRDRIQGAWNVKTFQSNDEGDVRVSQVVIRGDLLLVNTIVDGIVLGTSPWKLVWPNSDAPFEIEAIWDPNNNPEAAEGMPGRIAYDGKSFQIAIGEKRPREICPGEEIIYIDCIRATVPTETANQTAPSDNDLSRHSSSLPTKHDAKVDLAVFDWNNLLKLLPESGTVLVMFSHEPDKREQMLPIAEKVAEETSVKMIHLPIDNWRKLFSKEATHFVLMKDRQLIGTKTGLVTEAKLKEFVAQAKDWLTPHSTGVMESSLVRVDCYISPGNDNVGSQHGPAIPITLAAVAIDGDEALLFGTEGIAKYLEKGCACVAIVRDEKGKEKQVPIEVVLTGNVPLKKPDALNDDDALVITIPFFKYDKEYIELQEAYEVGSAIYRIRGAHGLTTVKLAPFDSTPQKGERVLAGEFNSSRHHGPIHGFQSPFHWQTQQNLSESDWSIYGANIHGAKMFEVLCPTIPAPSSFLFNAHGRLIGTGGLGNLTEKDKTYTALMPYAIHSVLHAGLEAIAHVGLKAALKQTLEESTSTNPSKDSTATILEKRTPVTPAIEMQQRLQGEWDVKVMGYSPDMHVIRPYQAVVRGQLFLLQCLEDGKVIGTSTWKMIWPEADHPDVVDIVWDPNNNSDEHFSPGRVACDGKSFQVAWRSDASISGQAIRPTEICSGDGISYFECVRKEPTDPFPTSRSSDAPAGPKYSGHPISWWLDSYWDNATAIPKTAESIAHEYVASEAIRKLREKPECKAAIEAALAKWFASVEHEVNEVQLTRAAKCFVTAAGPEYQELAVHYLCKIWSQLPTLSLEKQVERLGEETELNDLLKQLVLNDALAIQFAERLSNGTSSDRSLVTYYLFCSNLLNEKDPKIAELNTWLHHHRELFVPAFTAALKDESEQVRLFSLGSLVGLDQKLISLPSTLTILTMVVESDSSPLVRRLAIEMISSKEVLSVAKTQNIEVASLMIKTLESDSSIDVRNAALGALMAMDKDSELVHATLLEWARCKERLQVEYALTLMLRNHEAGDRPQSIDELIELLSDPEWGTKVEVNYNNWSTHHRWARQYAIAILGQYAARAHRAIPTLEAELARNNKDTLSFATQALDRVRGYCPDLPIEELQGDWEFVSMEKPEGSTPIFDFQASSDQQPSSVITITGTQLKLGDRVLAEISHYRTGSRQGMQLLLDPDGRKLHCNGSFRFAGGASPSVGAATSPQTVTLEICELHNEHDSTQGTKQTYELQVKELH